MGESKRVIAIVPCYNETAQIHDTLKRLAPQVDHIVAVNDGSKDDTEDILRMLADDHITVLSHIINLGKGAAVRTGCDYALDHLQPDVLVLVDGDGQHDPKDIPRFLHAQESGADIVYGARKREGQMPYFYRIGNWMLTHATSILFKEYIQDTQCGFRLLTANAYRKVRWQATDYSMESEMIARAGFAKLSYAEIPIETIYLEAYKGTGLKDGIKIALRLLKWRIILG